MENAVAVAVAGTSQFRTAIVKIASRCNLNCSYCYMYNLADTTYRGQPRVMSHATVDALVRKAADHCARHGIAHFRFVFHGGEPLLAEPALLRYFVERAAAEFPPGTTPLFSLQTNGTLLTQEWCELLRDLGVLVGISVDGPKARNDVHRVDHTGAGSYDRVRSGWDLAVANGLQPGLLTVVDVAADPIEIFEHVLELRPRKVDFLLPDANYETQPAGMAESTSPTPYADWLLRIFDVWIAAETPPVRIRLFEQIIGGILGAANSTDALGPGPNEVVVIETDGGIEPVDVLKACKHGITKTPLNVGAHALDDAFAIPVVELYHLSNERLCATCERCPVKSVCAGGYLPHRYKESNAFDNPSVYCADLLKLITVIQNWVLATLPADVVQSAGVVPLALPERLTAARCAGTA